MCYRTHTIYLNIKPSSALFTIAVNDRIRDASLFDYLVWTASGDG